MSKIFFISDYFSDEIIGGAELTTDAIISKCNFPVSKVKSANLDINHIKDNLESKWIFGNFTQVNTKILIQMIKLNLDYEVIEYDFKFCEMRSPQKHIYFHHKCNCNKNFHGKLISLFFAKAKRVWFMSELQRAVYVNNFPFLKKQDTRILSSVFCDKILKQIESIKYDKNNKYIILKSRSWIKNTAGCVKYAQKNNLDYELVSGLSHKELLKKLGFSKGLIFLPVGGDTCPRITIEAKLLGCDLHLNDNVLHKNEPWFKNDVKSTLKYLKQNANRFWETLNVK